MALTYLDDSGNASQTAARVAACGRKSLALQSDIREEVAVEACFDGVAEAIGRPDILVNSAGINMAGIEVADMELSRWNDMMKTDLSGTFLTCRRFVRA